MQFITGEGYSLLARCEIENESLFEMFYWFVKRSNHNQDQESVDDGITVSKGSQSHIN